MKENCFFRATAKTFLQIVFEYMLYTEVIFKGFHKTQTILFKLTSKHDSVDVHPRQIPG